MCSSLQKHPRTRGRFDDGNNLGCLTVLGYTSNKPTVAVCTPVGGVHYYRPQCQRSNLGCGNTQTPEGCWPQCSGLARESRRLDDMDIKGFVPGRVERGWADGSALQLAHAQLPKDAGDVLMRVSMLAIVARAALPLGLRMLLETLASVHALGQFDLMHPSIALEYTVFWSCGRKKPCAVGV